MAVSGYWLAVAAAAMLPQLDKPQPAPAALIPPAADPEGDTAIVPEVEFDAALPPLSDDIAAPLEPIPAAPLAEPALVEALPPLASFDATPPVEVADVDNADAPEIKYDVAVTGLDKVGLEDQFRALSALEDGDGKAANAAMIAARGREDEALAVRLLKSLGYYDGSAVSSVEQRPGGGVRAVLSATPGKQYALGSVTVQAQPTLPAGLVEHELPLRVGDPIEAIRVQGAEANVALKLAQQGYPFVAVGERDILLDDATWTGAYTLPVDTGPRASFGGVTTAGTLAFDADHLAVFPRFEPGELYDNRKVDDLRDALVATGLFSTVSVEPVRTGRAAADGTEAVDLLVRQTAGPARSLAASGGYSTGQGLRVEGSFTHRNLFRPEGALIVTGVGGTQEQGLGVTFRRSKRRQARPHRVADRERQSYELRRIQCLHGDAGRADQLRFDADLAEARDLLFRRRTDRHERERLQLRARGGASAAPTGSRRCRGRCSSTRRTICSTRPGAIG